MGGGGVIRVAKFTKYLPDFGWLPVILTSKGGESDYLDLSLQKEIEDKAMTYNTFSVDFPLIYRKIFRGETKRVKSKKTENHDGKGYFQKIKAFIDNYIFIPDSRLGWIPFALFRGIKIVRKEKIQCIYSTGGPWTNHIIALLIKIFTKRPWVVDYRDLWAHDPFNQSRPEIRQKIDTFLERTVILNSDIIISVTNTISKCLIDKYQPPNLEKFFVLPNGYDPEDFLGKERTKSELFRIVYTGSLNEYRTPVYFFEALKDMFAMYPEMRNKVCVSFVGEDRDEYQDIIDEYGLQKNVFFTGYLLHSKAIEKLFESDLLLLISYTGNYSKENAEVHLTGKIFEYLATGTPILALTEDGILADLIRKTRCGFVVQPDDICKIGEELRCLYLQWKEQKITIKPNWALIRTFDRRKVTEDLAKILESLSGGIGVSEKQQYLKSR
jgi:glycosyltransferase involved in cell wall biosynthesis